jgi:hypothetical protein
MRPEEIDFDCTLARALLPKRRRGARAPYSEALTTEAVEQPEPLDDARRSDSPKCQIQACRG